LGALKMTTTSNLLKQPQEWAKDIGLMILDPDGWRRRIKNLPERSFNDKITAKEFNIRMVYSTCEGFSTNE